MLTFRLMGSKANLAFVLRAWPEIEVQGGHTDVLLDTRSHTDRKTMLEMVNELVVMQRWAAIDTSNPAAPVMLGNGRPGETAGEMIATLERAATSDVVVSLVSPLVGG